MEYGPEVAQEYEERFLSNYDSYGAPQIEELPNNLNFNAGVQYINQVVTYDRITFWGYITDMIKSGSSPHDDSGSKSKRPEIAFGRRIIDKPVVDLKNQLSQALGGGHSGGSPAPSQQYAKL